MSLSQSVRIGVKALIPVPSESEWRYLFLERANVFPGEERRRIDTPGGRMEDEDFKRLTHTPYDALGREVWEETRLRLLRSNGDEPIPLHVQEIPLQPAALNVIRITHLARVSFGPILLSDEHDSFDYLTRGEALDANVDPYLRSLLEEDDLFRFEQECSPENLSLAAIQRLVLTSSPS